jgi:hypothetical protein
MSVLIKMMISRCYLLVLEIKILTTTIIQKMTFLKSIYHLKLMKKLHMKIKSIGKIDSFLAMSITTLFMTSHLIGILL